MDRQIALQLYTVRRELQENPRLTLERIKAIGMDSVEVAPLPEGVSAADLASQLESLALNVVAIHCDLPIGDRLDPVTHLAETFDCRRVIWHGWPRDEAFDTLDGLDRLTDRYNEAQANVARRGLELGLHNHWWEFEPLDGQHPLQLLLKKLSPEIFFEIDTYWVRAAGLDPALILRELKNRVSFLHLKDGPARKGEPMTALGEGVMDFHSILNASPTVKTLVIELDECDSDIWKAIQRSLAYLHKLCS